MGSPSFVATMDAVQRIGERCRQDELSPDQFSNEVTDVFYEYLANEDPRDDVVALVDFCVDVARDVCELTAHADRVLPHRLSHQLRWILDQQGDGQSLDNIVRQLRARLEEGDEIAKLELVDLCRSGYETHQALFSAIDSEREILDLAYSFRVVAALDAAVRPTSSGRLANEDKSRGLALPRTLDLLAHLANDPSHPSGTLARDTLVELTAYPETSGMAGLRLPVHLLSSDQRATLHDIYLTHEEAMGPEIVRIFISDYQLRDREILRSALWQANDAQHFTRAAAAAGDDSSA
ncbi:MAG: hypothetical protein HKN94_13410 [Acidimicrobiales bacterium]|nr:hypothetical protein [Acidimicrobiales bacterium]